MPVVSSTRSGWRRALYAAGLSLAMAACGPDDPSYVVARVNGALELGVAAVGVDLYESGSTDAVVIDDKPDRFSGTLPIVVVFELRRALELPLSARAVGYDASDAAVALGVTRFAYTPNRENRVDIELTAVE